MKDMLKKILEYKEFYLILAILSVGVCIAALFLNKSYPLIQMFTIVLILHVSKKYVENINQVNFIVLFFCKYAVLAGLGFLISKSIFPFLSSSLDNELSNFPLVILFSVISFIIFAFTLIPIIIFSTLLTDASFYFYILFATSLFLFRKNNETNIKILISLIIIYISKDFISLIIPSFQQYLLGFYQLAIKPISNIDNYSFASEITNNIESLFTPFEALIFFIFFIKEIIIFYKATSVFFSENSFENVKKLSILLIFNILIIIALYTIKISHIVTIKNIDIFLIKYIDISLIVSLYVYIVLILLNINYRFDKTIKLLSDQKSYTVLLCLILALFILINKEIPVELDIIGRIFSCLISLILFKDQFTHCHIKKYKMLILNITIILFLLYYMWIKKYYFLVAPIFFIGAISMKILFHKIEKNLFHSDFKASLTPNDKNTLRKYNLDPDSNVNYFIDKINEINIDYKIQEDEIKTNKNKKRKISKTLIIKLNILLENINNNILRK